MAASPSRNGRGPERPSKAVNPWEAVRHRPLLSIGAPLLIIAATLALVTFVKPVYEASASIRIDEDRSGVAVLEMLQSLNSGSEVFTEMAVLESRTLAEDVVRALDLQLVLDEAGGLRRGQVFDAIEVDTAAPAASYALERTDEDRFLLTGSVERPGDGAPSLFGGPATEEVAYGEVALGQRVRVEGASFVLSRRVAELESVGFSVRPFMDAVRDLREEVDVSRPDREADLVVVRFQGNDPALVQAVPNALVSAFLARRQSVQSAEARATVDFLAVQLDTLYRQLSLAEVALRDFREANQIVAIEAEADARVQRLAGMQAQRDLLETERAALARFMAQIDSARANGEASPYRELIYFPTLLRNTATAQMLGELATLESERALLMQGRTLEDRDVRLISDQIQELEDQLGAVARAYLQGLSNQVASTNAVLARSQDELAVIPAQQMTYVRLSRQAEILSDLFTYLQTKQKEAQIAAAVQDQSIRVVDPARRPSEPIRPRPMLSLLLAVVVGGVVGVGGAVVAEHVDGTVRNRGDLQDATGAAVLGLIPVMGGRGRRLPWPADGQRAGVGPRLVSHVRAGEPAAEAYRALRTNINFARPSAPPRAVVFTSPMPGDGKSTTAANLALVLAHQGGRVLLVDADMRRGVLNEVFEQRREPGLSNVLFGSHSLDDAVREVALEGGHRLHVLTGGTRPPNPAELLSSEPMERLLAAARERYDTVIFDAPPLNLVTDAALLGALSDGVVLVARAGVTEDGPLAFAVHQLEQVRAPLLGTVLNGLDARRQEHYGGRYGKAYAYFDEA